jgi:hypothetical protein
MVCPLDNKTISQIEASTGLRVKPILCSPEDIRSAINRYYPHSQFASTGKNPEESASDTYDEIAELEPVQFSWDGS